MIIFAYLAQIFLSIVPRPILRLLAIISPFEGFFRLLSFSNDRRSNG